MNRNDDPKRLIGNALHPAEVRDVLLYDSIRRAIVLVREDQLSIAIGQRGESVRAASKLTGWDIEVMTPEEFDEQIERVKQGFGSLHGASDQLAARLVEQGYLSFGDLSIIEFDLLKQLGSLTEQQADAIIEQAQTAAENEDRR